MECETVPNGKSHGWLDHLAIGMAAVCVIHCLLTPILLVALPIISTTFFVDANFHLWMILLVLPTTGFAVFMGCKQHRDEWVAGLSAIGLSLLIFVVAQERLSGGHAEHSAPTDHHCEVCAASASNLAGEPTPLPASAWINTLGGLFLVSGHIRNFRLCRKRECTDC